MKEVKERKIIHIDMDAFYASVEQRDNPSLRGRPVAVGRAEERGVVAAASYQARRFGVKSAMPSVKAMKLCPELVFVPARMDVYRSVSASIHDIFHRYTDVVEPLALDEAFLDVTYNKKGMQYAMDIAAAIKSEIRAETGLVASAGVSYNKFLAKIASDYRKPDGLYVIHPSRAAEFISRLPIESFWGVGGATAERMRADAKESYNLRSFENPVWQYAAVRNLLYRNGKAMEIFESYEPGFKMFGGWWQQLFGESEGKDGKGLFPVTAEFTADLHSLGQMIQQGQRNIFETMVRFDPPAARYTIGSDWKNLDGLNYLEGKTLDFVDEKAYLGTVAAHVDGGVPVITMDCGELNDRKVGELFYFLELCCGVSAYILDVNPFNQPGVELYKRNMFQLLGKPGYEK